MNNFEPRVFVVLVGVAGCRFTGADDLVVPIQTVKSELGTLVSVTGAQCSTAFVDSGKGHVVYTSQTYGHIFRVEAEPGAAPEDLSIELDRVSKGTDSGVNVTLDGRWLVVSTTRFGCGDDCLALVSQDACSGRAIVDANGNAIEPSGLPAIASLADGDLVLAYPLDGSGGRTDIYTLRQHAGAWGAPRNVTGKSPFLYNEVPTLSADGSKVLLDCGTNSYAGGPGTAMCEAATDGSDFQVLHLPSDGPPGMGSWPLHKANYTADGAIVFEGEWPNGGERIWQYAPSTAIPAALNEQENPNGTFTYSDDNTPCLLPDGRVVSLWLERVGNVHGYHEIKVMNADGTDNQMLVIGQNTLDIGHGCSE